MTSLDVLLVEDNTDDRKAFLRDLPSVFESCDVSVTLHATGSFEEAAEWACDGSRRFDMILSDTFRGEHKDHDAAVLEMIKLYRKGRFCPLVIFSASAMLEEIVPSAFVIWGDKTKVNEEGGIEDAIRKALATGVSQAARRIHNELDGFAGDYLWRFLEERWVQIHQQGCIESATVERIIRRRAAIQLADIMLTEDGDLPISEVHGPEVYLYPPVRREQYSLGEVVRKGEEFRVVLTPHCYLTVQQNQVKPRAEYIVTVKTVSASKVLGEKAENVNSLKDKLKKESKIRTWITPPSHENVGKPEGRYWFLPGFLDIPHCYCDFLQLESLSYEILKNDWEKVAVLSPPFSESLQACYGAFHGSVGIPGIMPSSVVGMLS
tara:strand:- start:2535 stop:3668 length:1134 start_codon:yes stop_codon:yes gene_type:complete